MKPLRFSREGTLKGLLLFALFANLSWEPVSRHFMDLSSSAVVPAAPTAPATAKDCTGRADRQKCAAEALSEAQRKKMADDAARAQAQGETSSPPPLPDNKNPKTTTEATAGTEGCAKCLQDKITAKEKELADLKKIAEKASTSSDTSSASTNNDNGDADSGNASDTKPRPTVADVRNCLVDTDGDDLEAIDAFQCQTKRLSSAKNSSEKREISSKIKELYTKLRKEAKDDLFAKDDSRRSDGEEKINKMISALDRANFDRDSERDKMIESLKGLRAGAEARTAALDLQDQVNDLSKDVKSARNEANNLYRDYINSCRSRTGCDSDKLDQFNEKRSDLADLKDDYDGLKEDIKDAQDQVIDGEDGVNDFKESLSRAEVKEFTQPFAKMDQQMKDMVDPRKMNGGTDSTAGRDPRYDGSGQAFLEENNLPSDFYEVRGGNSATNRGNGMYVPPQQQVNQPQMNPQYGPRNYVPQYLSPGMSQPLLPAPNGMYGQQMYGQQSMYGQQMYGRPNILPAGGSYGGGYPGYGAVIPMNSQPMYGQQQPYYGNQQPYGYGGAAGGPPVLPANRTY